MKLNPKLQEEMTTLLYMLKAGIDLRVGKERDEMVKVLLKGEIIGVNLTMELINEWNKPNHGMFKPSELFTNKGTKDGTRNNRKS